MCFSLEWFKELLVWLVIICAVVAILRLLVPFVLAQIGSPGGVLAQAINIVLWAVICIFVIYVVFDLVSCLIGAGGFPRLRH